MGVCIVCTLVTFSKNSYELILTILFTEKLEQMRVARAKSLQMHLIASMESNLPPNKNSPIF
jgi:hypothetical protein